MRRVITVPHCVRLYERQCQAEHRVGVCILLNGLQELRPGSQSVMQAHNSQQALAQGDGMNHLQP